MLWDNYTYVKKNKSSLYVGSDRKLDEVYELIEKAQSGDENASNALVEQNVGLIWSVVKKFMNRGYEADDLFQIGAIGLIKSIQKFDMNFEVKFSTYAVPMIIGEIKRFMRDDGMIKVSRPLKELGVKAKYMQDKMIKETGNNPSINEVAQALGVQMDELILALDANRDIESLYATANQNDGSPIFLIDKISRNESEEEQIVDTLSLQEVINTLKPKEKEIIMLRYFEDKTQSEVAKEVGVSQVQVSRIEKKVLNNMRLIMV